MKRETIITAITSAVFLLVFLISRCIITPTVNHDEPVKIGFIYDGDESIPYTNNFMRAQREVENMFGDKVEILARSNVAGDDVAAVLEEFAERNCALIFTTTYTYEIIAKEVAEKYPNVHFCQASGDNAHEEPFIKNYHTFMGEIYQGRYISGIVAGMKLKELIENGIISESEAKVGYVGAYPYSEVISGYTAFFLGVRSIVPNATMHVVYTYTWGSFSQEKICAEHLIEEGCKIISQHSDTVGPAVACEENFEKNVFHVGYNQSMIGIAPMTSLISTRINWIPYVTGAVSAVLRNEPIEKSIKGRVHGNDIGASFDLNWVQMLDLNSIIAAKGTDEKITETIKAFKKNKIFVFKGDYVGVNPYDETDMFDLKKGFKENSSSSAPLFHYILKDVITVEE
ncbi:MAG: BMP family ABC transporter substrate-binding protein [Treponema sp.]|nr:BMP family ABC transporter substrate-binding protein [Treponema sp.]